MLERLDDLLGQGTRLAATAAAIALASCQFDVTGLADAPDGAPDVSDADVATADAVPGADADEPADGARAPDAGGPPDADVPQPCPRNYAPLGAGGTVYRLGFDIKPWDAAEADCEDDGFGTHLTVIDDGTELDLIASLLGTGSGWVGVTDRIDEDVWLTVLGEPAELLPWQGGQPNDDNDAEDCVALFAPPQKFRDDVCTTALRYVCECDGREPDPDAYE